MASGTVEVVVSSRCPEPGAVLAGKLVLRQVGFCALSSVGLVMMTGVVRNSAAFLYRCLHYQPKDDNLQPTTYV